MENNVSVHVTGELLQQLHDAFTRSGKRVTFSVQTRHDGMHHVWGTRPVMASVLAVLLRATASERDIRIDIAKVLGR